jgi:2-polyprenyl-3-methyl-5-hydroxy-6-metoxy-1,4-benzoquinol methylase
MDKSLKEESDAFDRQIVDRVQNGHIPDMRRCTPCYYFYNNPWREPEYVQLDFGDQFKIIYGAIQNHVKPLDHPIKVLEVGCGPGYLSLELARQGFDVLGIDISRECLKIADRFSSEDPWKIGRGNLVYRYCDFLSSGNSLPCDFNAVVFLGSLHHFKDQNAVLMTANNRLVTDGIIVAHEPARDRAGKGNAALMNLIKVLLSTAKGFYQNIPISASKEEISEQVGKTLAAIRYENEDGSKVQSVHDNDAGYVEMLPALRRIFNQIDYKERYAFFHEIIGGLRFDKETNVALARYLRDMDGYLCETGIIEATEYLFVGKKM